MNSFKLDSSAPMIAFQFFFTNRDAVPRSVRFIGAETEGEKKRRESKPRCGELIIGPLERCVVADVMPGYNLTDVFHQERADESRRKYNIVRFVFHRVDVGGVVKTSRAVFGDFRQMSSNAVWTVKVFSNPFYLMGEEIKGKRVVEVSLTFRKPLFDSSGQPIKEWRKDENGCRIGAGPIPIRPHWQLRTKDSSLVGIKVCNGD